MSRRPVRESSARIPNPPSDPSSDASPGHVAGTAVTAEDELELHRRIAALEGQFRGGRDVTKVVRAALRTALDYFSAPAGCAALIQDTGIGIEPVLVLPDAGDWNMNRLGLFVHGGRVRMPDDRMVARLRRRGRVWGAIALHLPGAVLRWDERRALSSIARAATEIADAIDQERIREVRTRIDHKIMEQVRPKDLFYQIIRGLRSLTEYDHSASLLIRTDEADGPARLELVAEQIAWRKGKSRSIGRTLVLPEPVRLMLKRESVWLFDRTSDGWRCLHQPDAAPLAVLLDYNQGDDADPTLEPEDAMLCASLVSRDRVIGVMKIAARHAGSFGDFETDVIARFLPQVSVAILNNQRAENLQAHVLAAERKHAMADLARGVAHDVNNALGAVLPLVQAMRAEIEAGTLDPAVADGDLDEIERSMQVCRRIFGGMLDFVRGASRNEGDVRLSDGVDSTLPILREGFERRHIEVVVDVPPDLPPVRGVEADIEQLLLNLFTNARDAMPDGGRLKVSAAHVDGRIELRVEDSGCGIAADLLPMIGEPFFTTKQTGNGLGLAICGAIVSQMRGRMDIDSAPGSGTRVVIVLPVAKT